MGTEPLAMRPYKWTLNFVQLKDFKGINVDILYGAAVNNDYSNN